MKKYIVGYDYGMGGLWAYVVAESLDAIQQEYPELGVLTEAPEWMTDEMRARLETLNLSDPPSGVLKVVVNDRARKREVTPKPSE
jgi:hypothetical protein